MTFRADLLSVWETEKHDDGHFIDHCTSVSKSIMGKLVGIFAKSKTLQDFWRSDWYQSLKPYDEVRGKEGCNKAKCSNGKPADMVRAGYEAIVNNPKWKCTKGAQLAQDRLDGNPPSSYASDHPLWGPSGFTAIGLIRNIWFSSRRRHLDLFNEAGGVLDVCINHPKAGIAAKALALGACPDLSKDPAVKFKFVQFTSNDQLTWVEAELLQKGAPVLTPMHLHSGTDITNHWLVMVRESPPYGPTWIIDCLAKPMEPADQKVYQFFTGHLRPHVTATIGDISLAWKESKTAGFGWYEETGQPMPMK
jgi:hypothetical protein